jgi:hypothetical protein
MSAQKLQLDQRPRGDRSPTTYWCFFLSNARIIGLRSGYIHYKYARRLSPTYSYERASYSKQKSPKKLHSYHESRAHFFVAARLKKCARLSTVCHRGCCNSLYQKCADVLITHHTDDQVVQCTCIPGLSLATSLILHSSGRMPYQVIYQWQNSICTRSHVAQTDKGLPQRIHIIFLIWKSVLVV